VLTNKKKWINGKETRFKTLLQAQKSNAIKLLYKLFSTSFHLEFIDAENKRQIPQFLKGRNNLASARAGDQNPRSGDTYSIGKLLECIHKNVSSTKNHIVCFFLLVGRLHHIIVILYHSNLY